MYHQTIYRSLLFKAEETIEYLFSINSSNFLFFNGLINVDSQNLFLGMQCAERQTMISPEEASMPLLIASPGRNFFILINLIGHCFAFLTVLSVESLSTKITSIVVSLLENH